MQGPCNPPEAPLDASAPHLPVAKPWGSYRVLSTGADFLIKTLCVEPGQRLSLQRHRHRSEWWCVLQGQALVTLSGLRRTLVPSQTVRIEPGQWHRLENSGAQRLLLLEVQRGSPCSEDDIERAEDDFGRAPAQAGTAP